MDNKLSRDADFLEQHIAKLAALLEQHGLTHLEYETDTSRVVLGKEALPGISLQTPLVAATPTTAEMLMAATSPMQKGADATSRTGVAESELLNTSASLSPQKAAAASTAEAADGELIRAPLVGIAYAAKEPSAPPFVAVGDVVEEGTVLCLIEAMKMFNEVKAPSSGTITKIHFKDAELVEYGAPLFSLNDSQR